MRARLGTALLAACLAGLALASLSEAAFPGANGKIVFTRWAVNPAGITTVNPDGTGEQYLANGRRGAWSPDGQRIAFDCASAICVRDPNGSIRTLAGGSTPAWSPDGSQILFSHSPCPGCNFDIYKMNADGSGVTQLTNTPSRWDESPAWAPDGSEIAFESWEYSEDPYFEGPHDIHVIDPSGAGETSLTGGGVFDDYRDPAWSPNAGKLAVARCCNSGGLPRGISTLNRDGTGETALAAAGDEGYPAWSPDGRSVAFTRCCPQGAQLFAVDAAGGAVRQITNRAPNTGYITDLDWQPVADVGYVRPKGATPLRVSLVPAFTGCSAPNSAHGSPLAFPSCEPTSQTSSYLTVGTLDANGQESNSVAFERLDAIVGNPATVANEADVRLVVSASDVRRKSDLAPYPGTLRAVDRLRITDHDSTDGVASTIQDIPLSVAVSCFLPPTTFAGSTCSVGTTANAIAAGLVTEGHRTTWALDRVELYDGGADSDGSTTSDNALFMDQGVFVP